MGKTLSIEIGIRCNNRCSFCYQSGWRSRGSRLADPSFETLVGKLKWGMENGYDSVGFSGGEPTIRRDMVDLVRTSVELGFCRVSITTNGRRFSNREFAKTMLEAGLDSIGWSLHGPDARMHDALVGREGAFRQVMEGMKNVSELSHELNVKLDQNLFVLVNTSNHRKLARICRLGRRHGIKLMIFQPVIYSKGNVSQASRHAVELTELVGSVRKAARAGKREGWFVKLFNLPPCFFPDMLEAFEHQRYPVDIFRYQEKESAGESRVVAHQGYVLLDRCTACLLQPFCPGLHQSLIPQEDLLDLALSTLDTPEGARRGEIWLSGTELMAPETLTRFISDVRARPGVRGVKLYHGGDSVAGDRFVEAVVRGGVSELCLVHSGLVQGTTDMSALSGGNSAQLGRVLESPLLSRRGFCEVSVAIPFVESMDARQMNELYRFARAGCRLEVQLPWDFKRPEVFELFKLARLAARWAGAEGRGLRVVVPDDARLGRLLFRHPVKLFSDLSVAASHYARHYFSGRQAGWISLSVPPFALEPDSPSITRVQPVLAGLAGSPIDEKLFNLMRPG